MKQRILKYLALGAFAATLASCLITDEKGGHGPATRAETYDDTWEQFKSFFGGDAQEDDIFFSTDPQFPDGYGREADRNISTFRVLVFYGSGNTLGTEGDLAFWNGQYANHRFTWDERNTDKDSFSFELPTGRYDFMFIANDNDLFGDYGTTGLGGSDDPDEDEGNVIDVEALKEALFTYDIDGTGDDADGQIHSDLDIPMATWIPGVDVELGKISFTDHEDRYTEYLVDGKAVIQSEWPVWMKRAAIRLSFGIRMGAAQYAAWKQYHGTAEPLLYIEGLRNKGWVYPHPASTHPLEGSTNRLPLQQMPASTITSTIRPGKIIETDGGAEVFFDRMIYPEHLPQVSGNSANALRAYMRFDYGGQTTEKDMLIHSVPESGKAIDYSLPRNTWVWTRAEVLTDINYIVRVVPWGDGPIDPTKIMQYNLVTDRSEILFRAEGHNERMSVWTDYPADWTIDPAETNFGDGGNGWFTVSPLTGPTGSTTLATVTAQANGSGKVRSGSFVIRAGNLLRTIVVTQLPAAGDIEDTTQGKATMYVGAFWKASQYGERLIRVDRTKVNPVEGFDGPWAAYVIEGDDWIVLDTEQSKDDGVGTDTPEDNGNDTGFDATYRVGGYHKSVSGTMGADEGAGDIYFRVGLNGPYTPTADRPVRYGMILLAYTNGGVPAYQRIWVRQGEESLQPHNFAPCRRHPICSNPRQRWRMGRISLDGGCVIPIPADQERLRACGLPSRPTGGNNGLSDQSDEQYPRVGRERLGDLSSGLSPSPGTSERWKHARLEGFGHRG